jgi:hypothetical protein
MGLDMFLYRMPRYNRGATPEIVTAVEDYLNWKRLKAEGNRYAQGSFRDFCGKDAPAKHYRDYYQQFFGVQYDPLDKEKKYPIWRIREEVGYWRKANQIHNWFVENVQDGIDDCCYHREVTKEDLEELLDVCHEVICNPDLAELRLPTQSGFFFGSTEYGDWYMSQIHETIEVIEVALKTTDFEKEMIYYCSSW